MFIKQLEQVIKHENEFNIAMRIKLNVHSDFLIKMWKMPQSHSNQSEVTLTFVCSHCLTENQGMKCSDFS